MGDMGKRLRPPFEVDLPQPIPQFQPVKKPIEVEVEERELVPVKPVRKID